MNKTIKTVGLATLATLATLALTGCGGGGEIAETGGVEVVYGYDYIPFPDAPAINEAEKQTYINAINEVRSVGRTCGEKGYFSPVPPVRWHNSLYLAAYEHGLDLGISNTYSHGGSGTESDWTDVVLDLKKGSTMQYRAYNNGYPERASVSENVAAAYTDFDRVMTEFLKSPGHCATVMTGKTDFAVAKVEVPGSQYYTYWTLMLGSTQGLELQ